VSISPEKQTRITTDVVVIGAGFSGLSTVHHLVAAGHDVQGIEAGNDVGGTWFWNRYPGARTDSEGTIYSLSFADAALDWKWSERFPGQPEVLRYLQSVAEHFDLKRHFRFGDPVKSAVFADDTARWSVVTESGAMIDARYVVSAVGYLSAGVIPDLKGVADFEGTSLHTSRWPEDGLDLATKRVAIIGTGSTGIQLLPAIASSCGSVTVFQRTPNYVVPAANRPLDASDHDEAAHSMPEIRATMRQHPFAMPYPFSGRSALDFDEAQRTAIYEEAWHKGGFRFMIEAFDDIAVNKEANDTAADFLRAKIREIVQDPAVAKLMLPEYPYAAKRPPSGIEYLEAFNRDNVHLVDVRKTPIEAITADGIRTSASEQSFDVIIYATGYDFASGAIGRIDIRGRDGLPLKQHWENGGARTFLSMAVHGFPNLFLIGGPHISGGNFPTVAEFCGAWVSGIVTAADERRALTVEANEPDELDWTQHVNDIAAMTLQGQYGEVANDYFRGYNIEGKSKLGVLLYAGGAHTHFDRLDEQAESGYPAFKFTSP
jgi:cation diffusion facilitator CzcD-associated flavoprotein CzcO